MEKPTIKEPRDLGAELRELIAAGLQFPTAVRAFADDQAAKEPGLAAYWKNADDMSYVRDGEVEIDSQGTDGAGFVSKGDDNGAYVLGWVWVDNATAGVVTVEDVAEAGFSVICRAAFMAKPDLLSASGVDDDGAQTAALKARAEELPGKWIIYDPADDADGWLLIGDDLDALLIETHKERIAEN